VIHNAGARWLVDDSQPLSEIDFARLRANAYYRLNTEHGLAS